MTRKRRGLNGIIGCFLGGSPRPSGAGCTRQPGFFPSAGGGTGLRGSAPRASSGMRMMLFTARGPWGISASG